MRAARRYLIAAAGCALFAIVYAQFSHGVHSPFMTFMFAIPLVGGALPALVRKAAKAQPLPRITSQAWALAIAALTIASCRKGVFEIAGTSSSFLVVYVLATIVFLVMAAAGFFLKNPECQ